MRAVIVCLAAASLGLAKAYPDNWILTSSNACVPAVGDFGMGKSVSTGSSVITVTYGALVAATLASAVAYPGNFLNEGTNIGCYAAVGGAYMGGVVDGSSIIDIAFSPALGANNAFALGQNYTVTITNTGVGMSGRLLGADGGTFGTPTSGCDGSSCGNSRSGTGGCYPCQYNGVRTTAAGVTATGWSTCGSNTGTFVVTWTAPSSGTANVNFGTSRAADYGTIYTKAIELVNPNGGGASPTLSPTTSAPTAPTASRPYETDFCNTGTPAYSDYGAINVAGVNGKACWKLDSTTNTATVAIEAPNGQYTALGFSPTNSPKMSNLDIYAFTGDQVLVMYAAGTGLPDRDTADESTYAAGIVIAAGANTKQVVFTRPLAPAGNRVSLEGSPSYYVALAEGTGSGTSISFHSSAAYSQDTVALATAGTVQAEAENNYPTFRLHGIFMILAWMFLCPTAVADARFAKGVLPGKQGETVFVYTSWFRLHQVFQCLAVLFTIIGYIVIKSAELEIADNSPTESGKQSFSHKQIGTAVVVLSIVQVALGFLRNIIGGKHSEAYPHGRNRYIFNYAHWAVGLALVILSLNNVFSGVGLFCVENCDDYDSQGWVKTPIKSVYGAGVYFAVIAYLLVAMLQLAVKFGGVGGYNGNIYEVDIVNVVGRHALALVAAMMLACAITMAIIVSDSGP